MATTMLAPRRQIGSPGDVGSVVRTMETSAALVIGQYERSVAGLADCATGSMGPEVEGARAFVLDTGQHAKIASPDRIEDRLAGSTETQVSLATAGGAGAP